MFDIIPTKSSLSNAPTSITNFTTVQIMLTVYFVNGRFIVARISPISVKCLLFNSSFIQVLCSVMKGRRLWLLRIAFKLPPVTLLMLGVQEGSAMYFILIYCEKFSLIELSQISEATCFVTKFSLIPSPKMTLRILGELLKC